MKNKKSLSILILVLLMLMTFTACSKPSEDKISSQMKAYLYEKYGEEFEVDTIGYRTANKDKFYQARIYPKSIIGTPKEEDEYYYASASIDVDFFGRLKKGTGDSYSFINRNDDVEKYLMPKAIELFGDRIRMKVDVKHEVTAELDYEASKEDIWWAGYKSSSLAEMRKDVKENPKTTRIVLGIAIYVFDKIDSEEEKEERRKEIFDFIQYLKKEGLFEYLRLTIRIVDERALANSYRNFREQEHYDGETVYDNVINNTIDIPKLEFRKEMTKVLTKEYINMSNQELMKNMNSIKKSELGGASWEGYDGNSLQYLVKFDSINAIRINSKNDYEEIIKKGEKIKYDYNNISDVTFGGKIEKYKYIYLK